VLRPADVEPPGCLTSSDASGSAVTPQVLRHLDVSPQLPGGYARMIVLALFPPWWRGDGPPGRAPLRRRRHEANIYEPRRRQLRRPFAPPEPAVESAA
jgi:hypothetical protein